MVTIIEGMANFVMIAPLKAPHIAPLNRVKEISSKLENFDLKNPPVDPVELATDMLAHMRYFGGIGLSANQLGLPYRVFVTEGDLSLIHI